MFDPTSSEIALEDPAIEPISRTQAKKNSAYITKISIRLARFTDKQLHGLNLPEAITAEFRKARVIKPSTGRNRQIKYAASLIRTDESCQELVATIEAYCKAHKIR